MFSILTPTLSDLILGGTQGLTTNITMNNIVIK